VRLLAGIVLSAAPAFADGGVHPVKTLSAGLYFSGYGGALNGVSESGMGPKAELALGDGRTQYFVEAGLAWVTLGEVETYESGFMTRGGLGARWIARSFDFDDAGAVEMTLDAVLGASKVWWESSGELVRPELSFGVGLQMRKFSGPHASIRFNVRAYFAPTDDDAATPVARCTSDCESSAPIANGGMMFSIGGAM
jgi:hypothetical protein